MESLNNIEYQDLIKISVVMLFIIINLVKNPKQDIINNTIILSIAAAGLFINIYFNGISALSPCLRGAVYPGIILYPFYKIKAMGGGNYKLLCACGIMIGLEQLFKALLFSVLAGGIYCMIHIIKERTIKSRFRYLFTYIISSYLHAGISCSYTDTIQQDPKHMENRIRLIYPIFAGFLIASAEMIKNYFY